jgi:NAD+ synthase
VPDVAFVTGGSDLEALRAEVTAFVAEYVERAGANGVVVPMSGGVDSTTTAVLAAEALGGDRVIGLSLPAGPEPADDAAAVANELGIEHATVDLSVLLDTFEDDVATGLSTVPSRTAVGNALARLRMTCAYFVANTRDALVCGTANRTERLLGYFTKHGDGGADLFPLGECYKTEVRALARRVGVPPVVLEKPPTAGFWTGQTDADELGAPYGLIDVILHKLVDEDLGIEGTAAELGVPVGTVERFARMHVEARHKRARPPTPDDGPPERAGFHELELDC